LQQGKSGAVPKIKGGAIMQCPCGGEVNKEQRIVKTASKAREWSFGKVTDGPIDLHHFRCESCTREGRIIYSLTGHELFRVGV
jgi:hypothetical protein